MISRLVVLLEKVGGARPFERSTSIGSVALGLWWAALLLTVLSFAGRYTKFVYIDF